MTSKKLLKKQLEELNEKLNKLSEESAWKTTQMINREIQLQEAQMRQHALGDDNDKTFDLSKSTEIQELFHNRIPHELSYLYHMVEKQIWKGVINRYTDMELPEEEDKEQVINALWIMNYGPAAYDTKTKLAYYIQKLDGDYALVSPASEIMVNNQFFVADDSSWKPTGKPIRVKKDTLKIITPDYDNNGYYFKMIQPLGIYLYIFKCLAGNAVSLKNTTLFTCKTQKEAEIVSRAMTSSECVCQGLTTGSLLDKEGTNQLGMGSIKVIDLLQGKQVHTAELVSIAKFYEQVLFNWFGIEISNYKGQVLANDAAMSQGSYGRIMKDLDRRVKNFIEGLGGSLPEIDKVDFQPAQNENAIGDGTSNTDGNLIQQKVEEGE